MKRNDFSQIGDLYGGMLNGLKAELVAEGKVGPGAKELNDKGATDFIKKSGPESADGFKPALQKKKAKRGENKYNLDKLSYEEDEEILEIAKAGLNKFMSKKSAFDKLFENVMGAGDDDAGDELQELGIGGDDEGDGLGDEDAGGEEDTVTVTLDRAAAQTLLDVLTAALGGDEHSEPDGDEGLGFGDDGDEEGDSGGGFYDEDEESKAVPHGKSVDMGKQNKVGNVKPGGGSASSAVTDKVGNDGERGHALHGAKQPNMGKQNKVGNLKQGQNFFR